MEIGIKKTSKILITIVTALFFLLPINNVNAGTIIRPANNLGLVGYWSFNEGTSTIATDFSGNSKNGTLVGMSHPASATSGWTDGKFGKALNFDGTDDSVSLDGFTVGLTHTLSVWIKPSNTADYQGIFTDSSGFNGLFFRGPTNKLTYYFENLGNDHESIVTVPVGSWTHVVVVSNGTTFTFYVNGVNDGSSFAVARSYTPINIGSAQPLASEDFNGSIDEVRIYNRVMGATEVSALYKSGVRRVNTSQNVIQGSTLQNGLVGLWSFNGPDVTDKIYDRSGQGNNGDFYGGNGISGAKTTGKVGQAFNFLGSGNVVDAGTGASLSNLSNVSISVWLKPSNFGGGVDRVVSKNGGAVDGWFINVDGQNDFSFYAGHSVSTLTKTFTLTDLVSKNEWSHIVVTWDGSTLAANVKLYKNGTEVSATGNNGSGTRNNDSAASFVMAGRSDQGGGFYMGKMDELRVYNRILTISEIKRLYLMSK